ncbi:hypothetical protein JCM11491_005574 [Sporobolomyces phaffii]
MQLVILLGLVSAVFAAPAVSVSEQHAFVAPGSVQSLVPAALPTSVSHALAQLPLDHLAQLERHLERHTEPRTVRLRADPHTPVALTEGQKSLLTLAGLRFVDVTNDHAVPLAASSSSSYPARLAHNSTALAPLFSSIDLGSIRTFLDKFTAFHSRYYRSQSGRDSQLFLLEHLRALHADLNPRANLTFREFDHEWIQKSIIVRWDPTESDKAHDYKDEVVILSAHQDSTNTLPFLPAPGADDDASGTSTLVSALTQLLAHKVSPRSRPVEFHFYSAEEGGLLGSNEIARAYRDAGKHVKAMFHMDVVAYVKPGTDPVIGMITDGTDRNLVEFMKLVVDEYATIPYAETQCGYGCSDFASFTKHGFPSTCLAEGKFADSNPNMHSMRDTVDAVGYSLEHIREFVRVAIGYAVELGGGLAPGEPTRRPGGRWRMDPI